MDLINHLFLCNYIPLPLSVVKIIQEGDTDLFETIQELKKKEIIIELKALNKIPGISIKKIDVKSDNIINLIKNNIFEKIDQNINRWKELGIKIISYFDNEYPVKLKNIKNPPKTLFLKGDMNYSIEKAISIIGTRNPTKYGSLMARKIGQRFGELGFVIVNGFAIGVDSESIQGCLAVDGKIVGILGSGLLNLYPKKNKMLFEKILKEKKGVFISEKLPESSVNRSSLATRNRISSALSLGNVFIEGSKTSGTRWQLKYGKEQQKPIIVLEPKEKVKETELPRDIIKNEKNPLIIRDIKDIDEIVDRILNE